MVSVSSESCCVANVGLLEASQTDGTNLLVLAVLEWAESAVHVKSQESLAAALAEVALFCDFRFA